MHTSSTQLANPLLRCQDDKLILHCENDQHWAGVLFVGFGLLAICAIISTGLAPWFIVLISLTVGMTFLPIGGYFLLLRTVVTIFDLRSRQVTRSISIGRDWYQRSHTYYFADIAGIGFKAYSIDQSVTLAMMGSSSSNVVPHRVLDILVSEVVLYRARILPVIGELVPARMAQHVRMDRKWKRRALP